MYIKKIIKLDKDDIDADIIVSDGKFDLLCYAWECENSVGDTNFELSPLMGHADIMTGDKREYKIQKLEDGHFDYKLQGKLIDIEKCRGKVQIGAIVIKDVCWIPRDIKVGDYIEFTVIRLDVVKTGQWDIFNFLEKN
ncbi:MAG: hypothetical protein K2M64_00065 [Clostridia bacterium]|nr:hypothetical protein [Clostridia bacterium]